MLVCWMETLTLKNYVYFYNNNELIECLFLKLIFCIVLCSITLYQNRWNT